MKRINDPINEQRRPTNRPFHEQKRPTNTDHSFSSTDLNNEDIFLQLTSYRDVAWDPVLKMTCGSCHLHMRRGPKILRSQYVLAL